jgi:hypothetical protein
MQALQHLTTKSLRLLGLRLAHVCGQVRAPLWRRGTARQAVAAGLAGLALGLAAGRSAAQAGGPAQERAGRPGSEFVEGRWAVTVCEGRPRSWISNEVPEGWREAVRTHEAAHRSHMAAFLSCSDLRSWLRESGEHPRLAEAQATCAAAYHEVFTGRIPNLWEAVWLHARLSTGHFGWPVVDAVSATYRSCGRFRTD